MPAPAAVQKQATNANKLHEELYGDKPEEVIADLPGAVAPVEEVVVDAPVETVEEVVEDKVLTPDEQLTKAEARYSVLQGKYNKEVPQLHQQVGTLTEELNTVRRLLASLEQANTKVEVKPSKKLLKDEEIEEYGEDMISVMRRAAKEEFMPLIEKLEEENTQLRSMLGNVSSSVTDTARTGVYRYLDAEIPNWKEINQEEGFLLWLDETDAFSGATRLALLKKAFEDNDAMRVVTFFNSYLNENAAVVPEKVVETVTETKVDLMSLAAPGKPQGGSNTVSAQDDKPIYTHAGIQEFYRDVQTGKFKGREDERVAIEQDIIAAGPENRIRTT